MQHKKTLKCACMFPCPQEMRARAARQQQQGGKEEEEGEGGEEKKTEAAVSGGSSSSIHSKSYRAFVDKILMPLTLRGISNNGEKEETLPEITTFIFKEVLQLILHMQPPLCAHGPLCYWCFGV